MGRFGEPEHVRHGRLAFPLLLMALALGAGRTGTSGQEFSVSPRYTGAVVLTGVRGEATHFDRRETWYGFGVQARVLSPGRPEFVVELHWLPEVEDTGPFRGQCGDGFSVPYGGQPPNRVLGQAVEGSVSLLWRPSPMKAPRLRTGVALGVRSYRERWEFICDPYFGEPTGKSHTAMTGAIVVRVGFGPVRTPYVLSLQWTDSVRLSGDREAPGVSFDGLRAALTIPVLTWH